MKNNHGHLLRAFTVSVAVFAGSSGFVFSADSTTPADNTQINQRDRSAAEPTADQASNVRSDRELMRQIRRSIVKDKSLSVYAHNVKIIARQGKVTLKGTVHTEEEKTSIGDKASAIAGADSVTNDISVKGS